LDKSAISYPLSAIRYVGRLDYKTTGLLLLTNDGELARRLTLPSSNIKRVYIATLHPKPMSEIKNPNLMRKFLSPTFSDDAIFDGLRAGAKIGGINYAPMEIEIVSRYPLQIQITLCEGKKNEIRIGLDHIGFMVKKLHRISYGPIHLGDLPAGAVRELTEKEIQVIGHRA
jgi:23S rRNA pseudouridine2605 synthase